MPETEMAVYCSVLPVDHTVQCPAQGLRDNSSHPTCSVPEAAGAFTASTPPHHTAGSRSPVRPATPQGQEPLGPPSSGLWPKERKECAGHFLPAGTQKVSHQDHPKASSSHPKQPSPGRQDSLWAVTALWGLGAAVPAQPATWPSLVSACFSSGRWGDTDILG